MSLTNIALIAAFVILSKYVTIASFAALAMLSKILPLNISASGTLLVSFQLGVSFFYFSFFLLKFARNKKNPSLPPTNGLAAFLISGLIVALWLNVLVSDFKSFADLSMSEAADHLGNEIGYGWLIFRTGLSIAFSFAMANCIAMIFGRTR